MARRVAKPKKLAAHDKGKKISAAAPLNVGWSASAFTATKPPRQFHQSHLTGPDPDVVLDAPTTFGVAFGAGQSVHDVDTLPYDPQIGPVAKDDDSAESSCGSHQLKSAKACGRHFDLRYVRQLKPLIEKPWFLEGTLFHACVAYHYGEMLATWPDFMSIPLMDRLNSLAKGNSRKVREALALYWYYAERFKAERVQPIAVEYEYRAKLGLIDPGGPRPDLDDFEVTCGTDLLLEENGYRYIDDYKTTAGEKGQQWLPSWTGGHEHTWQGAFNVLIVEEATKVPIDAFRIRRIKKRIPHDADINTVAIPRKTLDETRRSIRLAVIQRNEIEQACRANPDELAPPQLSACMGKYGACEYLPICYANSDAERDSVMRNSFVQAPGGLRLPVIQ